MNVSKSLECEMYVIRTQCVPEEQAEDSDYVRLKVTAITVEEKHTIM